MRGAPRSGIPRSEVVPGNYIPGFIRALVIILSAAAIVFMMIHGLSNGLLFACIIVFTLLIAGGWLLRGGFRDSAVKSVLPDSSSPGNARYSAQELRERADRLASAVVPEDTATEPPVPAARPVRTYRQMLSDRDLDERMKRVAGILIAPCPACGQTEPGLVCKPLDGMEMYLLDRDRALIAHGARIGAAIRTGTARVTDVVAQFDGTVPDDVWEHAL